MNPTLILIIDTAHPTARVLLIDDADILAKREWENTPQVGTQLLVYIEEALQELGKRKEDIARVAVHAGPGSSGLVRTGVTTATVLAQSIGVDLVPVIGDTEEDVITSARMGEPVAVIEPKYTD